MKKNLFFLALSVLLSTICAVLIIKPHMTKSPYVYASGEPVYQRVELSGEQFPDFTFAAENSVNAVVHVKVLKKEKSREPNILDYFFGYGAPYAEPRESVNAGSGVIISSGGYIVTNNHVVDGGVEFLVTMNNNKSFDAELIGTDPVTDIALLKVEADQLPTLRFGNSDSLRLGEWVLAIGSPYNLRSTITAGIVSAKGRSLPDTSGEFKIESFIQTDAAVNPGNSGGALVNTRGELVGINTAIATNTGSFTGYSFAVPSTIVQKVVADIMTYGTVQRGRLGISMQELTDKLAEQAGMKDNFNGVYVPLVERSGAAYKAGIRDGDVIVALNRVPVKSPSDVQEKINAYKPEDNIVITVVRNGKTMDFNVVLQGTDEQIEGVSRQGEALDVLGGRLEKAPDRTVRRLGLKGGVEVTAVGKGKMRDAGIREGFIITYINQTPVKEPEDIVRAIKEAQRSVLIEGVYPDGSVYYYGIGIK